MSHGSYDSNLGSEILILGGDIRSRSWLNIGDSYGTGSGGPKPEGTPNVYPRDIYVKPEVYPRYTRSGHNPPVNLHPLFLF